MVERCGESFDNKVGAICSELTPIAKSVVGDGFCATNALMPSIHFFALRLM